MNCYRSYGEFENTYVGNTCTIFTSKTNDPVPAATEYVQQTSICHPEQYVSTRTLDKSTLSSSGFSTHGGKDISVRTFQTIYTLEYYTENRYTCKPTTTTTTTKPTVTSLSPSVSVDLYFTMNHRYGIFSHYLYIPRTLMGKDIDARCHEGSGPSKQVTTRYYAKALSKRANTTKVIPNTSATATITTTTTTVKPVKTIPSSVVSSTTTTLKTSTTKIGKTIPSTLLVSSSSSTTTAATTTTTTKKTKTIPTSTITPTSSYLPNYYCDGHDHCYNYYSKVTFNNIPSTICTLFTEEPSPPFSMDVIEVCHPTVKPTQTYVFTDVTTFTDLPRATTIYDDNYRTDISYVYFAETTRTGYTTFCQYSATENSTTTTTTVEEETTSVAVIEPTPIPTPTTSTKCLPVYVTVTEKQKVTVTEKETVTVTVHEKQENEDRTCASKWQQCGGSGYTGPTCCESGSTCRKLSDYYSQCI